MVSLRRRRLLGLSSGVNAPENASSSPGRVHPIPFDNDLNIGIDKECVIDPQEDIDMINVTDSSNSKDSQPTTEIEVKHRKQHRRRRVNPSVHCDMRGVYLKNNRWQAAIKVDKKQIHLGTFNSQMEAAYLYDRAAFMCGRETNFVLPENEKEELRELKWDDFLVKTRNEIAKKRTRKKACHSKTVAFSDAADLDNSISS